MEKNLRLTTPLSLLLVLSACAKTGDLLKAPPIEITSFAQDALGAEAHAVRDANYPFHHVWHSASLIEESSSPEPVYVAPIDTELLADSNIALHGKNVVSEQDVESIARYMKEKVEEEFRGHSIPVVSNRAYASRIVELAIVELSPTDVARNFVGTALGAFLPGAGLISMRSSGSVAIEGVIRDASTNQPLLVFADRERGKTSPFSFNDFAMYSHARAAIDDWAEQLVKACVTPPGTRIADSSPVTLLPL